MGTAVNAPPAAAAVVVGMDGGPLQPATAEAAAVSVVLATLGV